MTGRHAGHDPVLLAIKAACAVAAVIALLLVWQAVQHARAAADHPCPPQDHAVLAPTGWGCAQSVTFGVTTR